MYVCMFVSSFIILNFGIILFTIISIIYYDCGEYCHDYVRILLLMIEFKFYMKVLSNTILR